MESGDGLIVRVRPRAATLTLAQVRGLGAAARRHGNGHIDLTRRANLQIRGVTARTLAGLQEALADLELLDVSARAEAVRNIVVSPLAGADPGETLDVRPLARALEELIAADEALWRLPGKFGFILDGGGALSLDTERADIRLKAALVDGRVVMGVAIDRLEGPLWLGTVNGEDAIAAVRSIAHAFLETHEPGSRMRFRDAGAEAIKSVVDAVGQHMGPGSGLEAAQHRDRSIGALRRNGEAFAVGFSAPFGRVDAKGMHALAEIAGTAGASEISVSPWRTIYVPVAGEERSAALLRSAQGLGFITDANDPLIGIEACPGAPACRSAFLDTRRAARAVAELRSKLIGVSTIHVSGCAKGCARSGPADLVLVGGRDLFGVMRNARAGDTPGSFAGAGDLGRLPEIAARLEGKRADA
jgi:precorrin-3B synthase